MSEGVNPPAYPSREPKLSSWTNFRIIWSDWTTGSESTVTGRSPTGPKRFSRPPKYAPPHVVMTSLNVQQEVPS